MYNNTEACMVIHALDYDDSLLHSNHYCHEIINIQCLLFTQFVNIYKFDKFKQISVVLKEY